MLRRFVVLSELSYSLQLRLYHLRRQQHLQTNEMKRKRTMSFAPFQLLFLLSWARMPYFRFAYFKESAVRERAYSSVCESEIRQRVKTEINYAYRSIYLQRMTGMGKIWTEHDGENAARHIPTQMNLN